MSSGLASRAGQASADLGAAPADGGTARWPRLGLGGRRPSPSRLGMPASASASASSASSCSAVGAAEDVTTTRSGSPTSVVPSGSATSLGVDRGRRPSGPRWRPRSSVGMWVASASTCQRAQLLVDAGRRRRGLAGDVQRDLDGDLLAAADEQQVDVLEVAADRVPLDALGRASSSAAVEVRVSRMLAPRLDRVHRARGPAARCAAGRRRGRRARPGPCRPGGCGGRRPCRTRCGARRNADLGHGGTLLVSARGEARRRRVGSRRAHGTPSMTAPEDALAGATASLAHPPAAPLPRRPAAARQVARRRS